ncbi:MAG TPA: deaminase [Candidatus Saccharimonadales bacterium]|nr:deaminase [Candidatus Saccharimonadales bacterium]
MKRVIGHELAQARPFFEQAAEVASRATCRRAKCGAVIVKDNLVIGSGYNAPPLNDETRRTCDATWDYTKKPKYDLTCCVHAEWRAVIDACKRHPDKLGGSVLYFMRVDENGGFTDAGEPYCTTCSRFTMEAGVGEFALWNTNGADIYTLPEYDRLSYDFYLSDRAASAR